ncbi:MAG: DEAD/DEAH box helicase [Actinobacteria bacterium]|nr:DEAD/DEAH box helicase [Actinomycetota bacterium]
MASDVLTPFHPVVRAWFEERFPEGPTAAQAHGWPPIGSGRDTLIAAPTGSGKTLAGFLVCIDQLFRSLSAGPDPTQGMTQVVYVSPLKALAVDIHHNLEVPLAEMARIAEEMGIAVPDLRVGVRTGDTPSSTRASMTRRPPHILVTTPESLYLMLTADRSRETLRGVRTVIIDEIHAVARDKRGSHLALSLERLTWLCAEPPVRIGLSATQRPIETVARLLVGTGSDRSHPDGSPRCVIVDEGHHRTLDLAIELPEAELEAIASTEQTAEVLDRIAEHVRGHRTTLIFVNTRRMAERVAHLLAERLGPERVAAHHGSLAKERRLEVENRLRAGDLSALVATASLELGIDVGPVELVCQIGSPRSLAAFLQRVGRSGHSRAGIPKGRLYPMTRDELVECAALLRGIRGGRLDALHPPVAPLDILAQQIVASCAGDEWSEDDLYDLVRHASPFGELSRRHFDEVIELLAVGITTGRGPRGAYLHRDRVNGVVRARRGARLAALTSGGAIPEVADYRVLLDPGDIFIGTVNEDWAIESMVGDVFLLGSSSWRIRRVEPGVVRVADAHGAPPSVPFWLGEAPARTAELSDEVSALRKAANDLLADGRLDALRAWLGAECLLDAGTADQLACYLAAAHAGLEGLPTATELVMERFFDETGGMQLVVHAPLGGRVNRGLGLALRKKFCRTFDFELQAAANDDAVVLSLGPQHSFPLAEVARYLSAATVADTLAHAVLYSPMFTARWRWNLNRSLIVLRQRGGRRNPPPIQRMESDDLMAAVFPTLAACQENVAGPIEIPDHPLVNQTMYDCLHEAMDVDGLETLVRDMETGEVKVRFVETTEPSVLGHEILSGRPYTFLDDAPLEERRTRALALPRGLPVEARALGRLDPSVIAEVRAEASPDPRDPDELHDLLMSLVLSRPQPHWQHWFDRLVEDRRAMVVSGSPDRDESWCAVEGRPMVEVLIDQVVFRPDHPVPPACLGDEPPTLEVAGTTVVRGHLDLAGPATPADLALRCTLPPARVDTALAALEVEGFALSGHFDTGLLDAKGDVAEQYCSRRLLTRIHHGTRDRLRREIEPVSAQDFLRFLMHWQHVAPGTQLVGRRGVLAAVEQLQGFELAAGAWEEAVLAARVSGYRHEWLDELCLAGEVTWGRLALRPPSSTGETETSLAPSAERGRSVPSRATPVSFQLRSDLPWILSAQRSGASPRLPGPGPADDVLACLRDRGALFHTEIVDLVARQPIEVEEALWDLVTRGLVTADGFSAVRSLLDSRLRHNTRPHALRRGSRHGLRRGMSQTPAQVGRWSLIPDATDGYAADEVAEAVAEQLLVRWGVVFRDLVVREPATVPWRDLLWALRRLEARGVIRGGRFVTGFVGEQYALPEAIDALRRTRRRGPDGETVTLSGADPLNLVGIITPGPRVPALRTNTVSYRDGAPVDLEAGQLVAG